MKKVVRLTESDLVRIVKRVIIEQNGSTTSEKQVLGPFSKKGYEQIKFYVFEQNGKYYIYMTNNSQKTPILFKGEIFDNKGLGYNTKEDAKKQIDNIILASGLNRDLNQINSKGLTSPSGFPE